jgi:D-lyxose ketol-isomerase
MQQQGEMSRRDVLKTVGAGLALAAAGGAGATAAQAAASKHLAFKNADFYDAAGKFKVDAGKDAVLAVMKFHGYPVFPGVKEKLWVSDYGLGRFTDLGLAACMFKNNEEDRYMLMDLFLLPGQMLPEHWHEATEKNPAKREGWLVRYGLSHIVGEGDANLNPAVVVPKCHMGGKVSVLHETAAAPGDFVPLVRVTSRHWQLAGPEGAILTEVANVHDDKGVRHSDPKIIFP